MKKLIAIGKKILFGFIIVCLLIIVGTFFIEPTEKTYLESLKIEEGSVINTVGNYLGTYMYVIADKEKKMINEVSEEEFAKFVKEINATEDFRYFIFDFEDGTGIHFANEYIATYGEIDDEIKDRVLQKSLKFIMINDDDTVTLRDE